MRLIRHNSVLLDVQTEVTSNNFVGLAMRTTPSDLEPMFERLKDTSTIRLLHAQMGLTTEIGEFADQLKRHIFYGTTIDGTNLVEEMGDMLWYLAEASDTLETHIEEVMMRVISKLYKRFPEKFTEEKAVNRDLGTEREALEENRG